MRLHQMAEATLKKELTEETVTEFKVRMELILLILFKLALVVLGPVVFLTQFLYLVTQPDILPKNVHQRSVVDQAGFPQLIILNLLHFLGGAG